MSVFLLLLPFFLLFYNIDVHSSHNKRTNYVKDHIAYIYVDVVMGAGLEHREICIYSCYYVGTFVCRKRDTQGN